MFKVTQTVLDRLGFSEYWDENGTWGGRTLTFLDGTKLRIGSFDEMDDDSEGYCPNGRYQPQTFKFLGWFAIPKVEADFEIVFLKDLYKVVKEVYPHCEVEFVGKCKKLKMDWGLE